MSNQNLMIYASYKTAEVTSRMCSVLLCCLPECGRVYTLKICWLSMAEKAYQRVPSFQNNLPEKLNIVILTNTIFYRLTIRENLFKKSVYLTSNNYFPQPTTWTKPNPSLDVWSLSICYWTFLLRLSRKGRI